MSMQQQLDQLDSQVLRQMLDRSSARYLQSDEVWREVAERLVERLDFIKLQPQLIVDFACRAATNSVKLAERYPNARIVNYDISAQLIRSNPHYTQQATINMIQGNYSQLPFADNSVDLLFANLMLHWSDNPLQTLAEILRVLRPNGLLMFTTLGPDTLQELRYSFQQADNKPHVHHFIDMHHIGDMLLQAQFSDPVVDMEMLTVTFANVQQLLVELRDNGAVNALTTRQRGLMGKNKWESMLTTYQTLQDEQGKLPATLEVIYGHAWVGEQKGLSSINEAGEVAIPVERIRRR